MICDHFVWIRRKKCKLYVMSLFLSKLVIVLLNYNFKNELAIFTCITALARNTTPMPECVSCEINVIKISHYMISFIRVAILFIINKGRLNENKKNVESHCIQTKRVTLTWKCASDNRIKWAPHLITRTREDSFLE